MCLQVHGGGVICECGQLTRGCTAEENAFSSATVTDCLEILGEMFCVIETMLYYVF